MSIENVCLVSLSNPKLLDTNYDAPLGLMYLASMLEGEGFNVKIEHLNFYDREEWADKIRGYDAYGFTVYTPNVTEISKLIKELNDSNALFIAGGPHATALPVHTKSSGFDIVVRGEGEYAFPKILKANNMLHLNARALHGGVVNAETITDLDTLPYPARHLVPLKKFNRQLNGRKSAGIISARGCPYNCAFCSRDVHGGLRLRSPRNVIGEINEIHFKYGFDSLHFYDGTFTARPLDELREICNVLKEHNITYRCTGDLRVDNTELLELLYDTGCEKYCIGVESGSQKVLNRIRKGTTVENNLRVIREAKDIGLNVKAFFIVGNPGETKETIYETIDFIDKIGYAEYDVYSLIPYPDSDIYKNPKEFGITIKSNNFDEYCVITGHGEGSFVVDTEELTAYEISKLYEEVRKAVEKARIMKQ